MAIARRVIVGVLLVGAAVGIGTLGAPSAGAGPAPDDCPPEIAARSEPGECDGLAVSPQLGEVGSEVSITGSLDCGTGAFNPSDVVTIALWEDATLSDGTEPATGSTGAELGTPDQVLGQVTSGELFTDSYVIAEAPSEGSHIVGAFCGEQTDSNRSEYTTLSLSEDAEPPSGGQEGTGFGGDSIAIEPEVGEPGDEVTLTPFEQGCGSGDPTLVFYPDYPDLSNVEEIDTFQNAVADQEFEFEVPGDANDPSAFGTVCPDGSLHWTQPWGEEVLVGSSGGAIPTGDFDVPHDRSSFSASLATPDDVDLEPEHVATNLIIALMMLLLVFPAEVFNATFEENYDEVTGWLRGPRNLLEKASAWLAGRGTAVGFGVVVAVAALLYGFLDPDVALDQASLALVLGIAASLVVGVLLAGAAARRYVSSRSEDQGRLRVYPAALFVAFVCVLVSRIVDFQPGYLYGVIAGIAFTVELSKEDDGRAAAHAAVAALVLAFASWLLWVPVQDMANDANPSLPILVVDAFLAAVFVGGVQGVVFGFVPMRFLPGAKVWAWSKKAWLIIEGIAAFAFVQILIHPAEAYDGNLNKMVILFVGFAALSFGFWGYFRNRAAKEEAAVGAAPPEADPPADPPEEP